MSDFQDMQELLRDFLTEAGELLAGVDNKLVELERAPDDAKLLNDIFRGFHTIKGGGGFLGVHTLVELCHLTENLFDNLRNRKLKLTPEVLDSILAATATVRRMFDQLAGERQPDAAEPQLLERLKATLSGETAKPALVVVKAAPVAMLAPAAKAGAQEPDWQKLYDGLLGLTAPASAFARMSITRSRPRTVMKCPSRGPRS